jgi:hypothetical protein
MRRALALVPFALYSTACAEFGPAMAPADAPPTHWDDPALPPPPPVEIQLSARAETMSHWQLPSSSLWSSYEKLTLIASMGVAPKTDALAAVARTHEFMLAEAAARGLAQTALPPDTMWVIDLHGAASVAFGATLSQSARVPIANVITFNNWPAEDELIPAEETLAALVQMGPKLPTPADPSARPVFLLDAWRLALKGTVPDEDTTDNRYFLTPADLPDATHLRAAGIRKVMYVVESLREHPREEDDLHEIFLAYQEAGIALYIVDLSGLTRPSVPVWVPDRAPEEQLVPPSEQFVEERFLWIQPRVTVLQDPYFYRRSRGGFGGAHEGGFPHHSSHGGGSTGVGWGYSGGGG